MVPHTQAYNLRVGVAPKAVSVRVILSENDDDNGDAAFNGGDG